MISPKNPVFNFSDFADGKPPTIFFNKKSRPDITLNIVSQKNYAAIAQQLKERAQLNEQNAPIRILIIGGSIDGKGIQALKSQLPSDTILVESDVAHGPNTNIIIDAHYDGLVAFVFYHQFCSHQKNR